MSRSFAVTGASGTVGRDLVPALVAAGHRVTVFGRDPARLASLFPGLTARSYDNLPVDLAGHDTLVHLAVVNNTSGADAAAFRAANVTFVRDLLEAACTAGVARLFNLATSHALDPRNISPYAVTKREGAALVAGAEGIDGRNIYCPAILASVRAGKLAVLDRLPAPLAGPALAALSALKPTLRVQRLAAFLLDPQFPDGDRDICLAEDMEANPFYRLFRGCVDLGFGLGVIVAGWWLMALVWAGVRLGSPGPGIFAQTRVGRQGRLFTCYKFRTMAQGTVQSATHDTPASAVTPLGAFLRRWKLDELPQCVNALTGEISLVGPRPCLPVQETLIEQRRLRGVLEVRPGITGLAQVRGVDMSDPLRLARMDSEYRAFRSVLLDIAILLATLKGSGGGDRVA